MNYAEVPNEDSPLIEIFKFASTTYSGYDRHGGVQGLQKLGNAAFDRWRATGALPESLDELRAALFFQARAAHFGSDPDADDERYVRSLTSELARVSGGSVKTDAAGLRMWLRRLSNRARGRG